MFASVALLVLVLPFVATIYVFSTFLLLLFRQAISPLRHLPGPPSPSFFMGNLREMHDQENTDLVARWEATYGSTFVYRGFVGGCRLMTTDPVAIAHILGRGYDYPKPDFIKDALASMAAGHEGLLTVEGEVHRKQRKILTPAFSSSHIKSLSPIFWDKAIQLRDIWINIVAPSHTIPSPAPPSDPLSPVFKARSTSFLPNPFSSFVSSKAQPQSGIRARNVEPARSTSDDKTKEGVKVDVLAWLARGTLDVIGEAGFGYTFNSLSSAATGLGPENELARAFGIIFNTARKFRVITILQVWFPILRRFRRNSAAEDEARETMKRIGLSLIEERRATVLREMTSAKEEDFEEPENRSKHDLLSLLIHSDLASDPTQRLSINEILCQISTFLAAGHETSSSALTWTLYALACAPRIQDKLRNSLRDLDLPFTSSTPPTLDDFQLILSHPYLDSCVRESLRLNSPITSTMRVAAHADTVPVAAPFRDRNGNLCSQIELNKGDIISVPIQAINKARSEWGDDAAEFRPERWLEEEEGFHGSGRGRGVQGLWGGILTFLNGNIVNGNRSCIGYRFALNEIKIFLYVLIRDLEFSIDSSLEIEKKVNVVTRPCVKSEPHMGNQMPLYLKLVPQAPPAHY